MLELYSAIWRVTGRRQILLVVLSLLIAGLAVVPLEFQKEIVNGLTGKTVDASELTLLCLAMMGAILVSLALKWVLGYRSGLLGEDVIRKIRRRIVSMPLEERPGKAQLSEGALATMISAEAEEIGKFTGGAVSDPVLQVGTLFAVVIYIAATQPVLGLIAIFMIFPQVLIVLVTQRQVNLLVARRIKILRQSTGRHFSSTSSEFLDAVTQEFDDIYETRNTMFKWKLSTKFILSMISGAGTVSVLLIGGWQVLLGNTDIGTIVAATAGLSRLQGPTSFLIAFYRQVSANRVKFELLRDVGVDQVGSY